MRADEIYIPKEDKDICEVCELHRQAYKKIKHLTCPKCGNDDGIRALVDNEIVGEYNYYTADQRINLWPVMTCNNCKATLAMIPTEIMYNANHDIYYTGGKQYLTDTIEGIKQAIIPEIEQYTKRILEGENLQPANLAIWIDYKIEHLVAEFLVEKGYKI